MHYYLADREARLVDPDAFALMLDLAGNVTETNTANFLLVERGTIVSPPTAYTLPGISRATVIELAARLGIPFAERDVQVHSAMNADEAFLSSTPYCLMPVTKINGAPIGDGRPGPVVRRLLAAWSEEVGLDIEKQIQEQGRKRHPIAMRAEELRELLDRKPFQPFRVRVSDGRSFDIRYPELSLLGESVFIIGIPAPDDPNPRLYDRQAWVMLNMIDAIEPLPGSNPPRPPS
jgi:hypothetical protein